MHPRERILGEINYRKLRDEPVPQDTLDAAKHWGIFVSNDNIDKTKGEPSDGED